jgi:hypothetical protein
VRAGCLAVAIGLLAAVALYAWTMSRSGREPDWSRVAAAGQLLREAFDPPVPTPSPRLVAAATVTPNRVVPPTPTPLPASPSPTPPPPTATRPIATPTPTPPREYVLTRDELDAELGRAIASRGVPLRGPRVRLVPSDRVALSGQVAIAIFLVPVELEAQLSIDGAGKVQVRTTRVDAVGSQLPAELTEALGRTIDDDGTRAVANALPADARARSVRVEPERIVVEVAAG